MNIAKITNRVATVTVVLLIYWVFIFICTTTFGFKVFQENITQFFGLSILGIFSILGASIVLNIMYNLTAIAENRAASDAKQGRFNPKFLAVTLLVSFAMIFVFLYLGDLASSNAKKERLISSAEALIEEQRDVVEKMADYSFTPEYLSETNRAINLLEKVDENFPKVTAILTDEIEGKRILLGFHSHLYGNVEDKDKVDFILSTSIEEREYLYSVFDGGTTEYRFSSNDGRHEIYFPVKTEHGIIVLHLSEYSRYGKIGSR